MNNGLALLEPTFVGTPQPATKIITASQESNEISVELWIKPANNYQKGPARLFTLSDQPQDSNITVSQGLWGQQPEDVFQAKIRTQTQSDHTIRAKLNEENPLTDGLIHIVFTRGYHIGKNETSWARLFVNGIEMASEEVNGDFSNWNQDFPDSP